MAIAASPNFEKELPFIDPVTKTAPQARSALSRCLKTLFGGVYRRTLPEPGTAGTTDGPKNATHVVHVLSAVEQDVAVKEEVALACCVTDDNKENIAPNSLPSPPKKKKVCFLPKEEAHDEASHAFCTPPRRFAHKSSLSHLSPISPPPIRRMPGFCIERAQHALAIPTMPEFCNTSPASELAVKAAAEAAGCNSAALRYASI